LGCVVAMGGYEYHFSVVVFIKEYILGGDVYFGVWCPHGCYK